MSSKGWGTRAVSQANVTFKCGKEASKFTDSKDFQDAESNIYRLVGEKVSWRSVTQQRKELNSEIKYPGI